VHTEEDLVEDDVVEHLDLGAAVELVGRLAGAGAAARRGAGRPAGTTPPGSPASSTSPAPVSRPSRSLAAGAPTGHENLLGTYDPEQATIAWNETLNFLRSNLR